MYGITDLKKNTLIQLDGVPYRVVEYNQKQVGRGGSIVNTKLKNLADGSLVTKTFKGADKVEPADVSQSTVQFLYSDDSSLHLMNNDSFEQYELSLDIVGDDIKFLLAGTNVVAQFYNSVIISVELPVKLPLKVTEAPEVVRGDTQSTVMKEVTLETGAKIQTPIFIKPGDTVVVDTRDGSYVERQKD